MIEAKFLSNEIGFAKEKFSSYRVLVCVNLASQYLKWVNNVKIKNHEKYYINFHIGSYNN